MTRHSTKKKSVEEYNLAIELYSKSVRIVEISKLLKLPQSTITNWVHGRNSKMYYNAINGIVLRVKISNDSYPIKYLKSLNISIDDNLRNSVYSLILGLYMGDGTINRLIRSKRFSIYLDNKYEKMNELITKAF